MSEFPALLERQINLPKPKLCWFARKALLEALSAVVQCFCHNGAIPGKQGECNSEYPTSKDHSLEKSKTLCPPHQNVKGHIIQVAVLDLKVLNLSIT